MLAFRTRGVCAFLRIVVNKMSIDEVKAVLLQVGLPLGLIPNEHELIVTTICNFAQAPVDRFERLSTPRESSNCILIKPPASKRHGISSSGRLRPQGSRSQLWRRHVWRRHEFFDAWGATGDVAEATRIVDICLDAGVNLFDTADVYSERPLGRGAGQGARRQARPAC